MGLRAFLGLARLRRKRYLRVAREVGLRPTDRVLELGCGAGAGSIAQWNRDNEIVGVDLLQPSAVHVDAPNFTYRTCDATDMSAFPDKSFDVAISFGMLEHILPEEALVQAIRETQRVARRYAFVVPHRWAFIEPHYRAPFFPVWPDALKRFVMRRTSLGTQRQRPDGNWRRMNWLTAAHWRRLFADPTVRVLDHWYGPLLLYRIIIGGR